MLTEKAREYPINGMESAPLVLGALICSIPLDDPIWDFTAGPERFTLRVMIAHVADWDEVYLSRVIQAMTEDEPKLPTVDEVAMARDRDYAHQDPFQSLARWKRNRGKLVAYIRSLPNNAFSRKTHSFLGEMTLDGWLARMMGHDMYHLRQTVDYIAANRPAKS